MKFVRNVNRLQLGKPLLNQGREQSSLLNLVLFFPTTNLVMGTGSASVANCSAVDLCTPRVCVCLGETGSWSSWVSSCLSGASAGFGAGGKAVKRPLPSPWQLGAITFFNLAFSPFYFFFLL